MHRHHPHHSHQGRKRDRTASPPLRSTGSHRYLARSPPLSPDGACRRTSPDARDKMHYDPTFAALLQDQSFQPSHRTTALLYDDGLVAGTVEYARMQTLQDVLRRTSLTEFRDRDIADWLHEMAVWLAQTSSVGVSNGSSTGLGHSGGGGGGGDQGNINGAAPPGRGTMNAEVRFVILGVLDTLPWWRLVESFGDGPQGAPTPVTATTPAATTREAADPSSSRGGRTRTVPHAFARWHEKIQINFERVCVALIDQSPRAVQGVLEVLMRPFHVRPPVRDRAERSLPCDSVIRVVSHVAARYPASFVLDMLEQCIGTLVPKQRWPVRRHHVACVAILLHLALESHVPIYQPQLGNQQSFAEARERFFSASSHRHRRRQGRGEGRPSSSEDGSFRLPGSTAAATSEESSTDASTTSAYTSSSATILGRLDTPSGYRSASGLFVESGIRLPPRTLAGLMPPNSAAGDDEATARVLSSDADDAAALAGHTPRLTAENPYNNKMMAYRNEIIRFLLRHLMSMELTLERNTEAAAIEEGEYWRVSRAGSPHALRRRDASAVWSPTTVSPGHRSLGGGDGGGGLSHFDFPTSPSRHGSASGEEAAADRGGLCATYGSKAAASARALLETHFTSHAKPFLKILLDCAALVFDKLAADLRRQQAAGACGNVDWWRELLAFHTHATLQAQYPVCLLYIAPSLALRGVGGEAADMLHKLISVVMKGTVPPQLQVAPPRSGFRGGRGPGFATAAGVGGASSGGAASAVGGVQPVRMRMAPPNASGAGLHAIPLDQRLRVALYIFPLFKFLRPRLGGEEEGLRRRLLKWVVQEMRKPGVSAALTGSVHAASSGSQPPSSQSRPASRAELLSASTSPTLTSTARLVEVVFAQCAAMSEHLNVDMVTLVTTGSDGNAPPSPQSSPHQNHHATDPGHAASPSDGVADVLKPLLSKYTLHGEPQEDNARTATDSGGATAGASPSRRYMHLDLHQLELEGLLKPNLMSFCPWPLTDTQ